MQKIRLDLNGLDVESFAASVDAEQAQGTVAAYEGPTRQCVTPGCTSDCV